MEPGVRVLLFDWSERHRFRCVRNNETLRRNGCCLVFFYLPLRRGRYGAAGALSNNVNELSKFIICVACIRRIYDVVMCTAV